MNLNDLYQEVILDHNRSPRNCHKMECANCYADGFNPLCGDKLTLFLKTDNNMIIDASFVGRGCAISTASASLMTENIIGKTISEANETFENFHAAIIQDDSNANAKLGKLSVLTGVKAFPSRVKCATLAWHTLQAALDNNVDTVSTE